MKRDIKTNLYKLFLACEGNLTEYETKMFLILVSDVANKLSTDHF